MKAPEGTFNQNKALVGAISLIVKTEYETDGSSAGLIITWLYAPARGRDPVILLPADGQSWREYLSCSI